MLCSRSSEIIHLIIESLYPFTKLSPFPYPHPWEPPFYSLLVGAFVFSFPGGSDGKSVCLQCRRPGFDPWVGKIPWRRKWQPTPVPLPGKSHGWRSLGGYSPWGRLSDFTSLWTIGNLGMIYLLTATGNLNLSPVSDFSPKSGFQKLLQFKAQWCWSLLGLQLLFHLPHTERTRNRLPQGHCFYLIIKTEW